MMLVRCRNAVQGLPLPHKNLVANLAVKNVIQAMLMERVAKRAA